MTDPQLFGRPSPGEAVQCAPTATGASSALLRLEKPRRRGIRLDWKVFALALAVVVAAVLIAVVFSVSVSAVRAASPSSSEGAAIGIAAEGPRSPPLGIGLNRRHAPDLR